MKGVIRTCLIVMLLMSWSTPAWVGTWTPNEFIYKPSVGSRGTAEKNLFDTAMNRLDARLAKEIWVGDPQYGTTLESAITALGSNAAALRIPPGTCTIDANLTIPSGITLKPERGAILAIADGVTLIINGGYEAGLFQTFSCTGTGKVIFGAGAVKEVLLDWWGPAADGATDDSPKLQAAIDSLATAKGSVKVPGKSYALAGTVKGRFGVRVEGIENLTTFVPTGAVPAFGQIEDFYNNVTNTGYWIAFRNFTIDASANSHDLDLMYFDRHFNMCGLQNIKFIGNPNQIHSGLHLYHTNPEGNANFLYHNLFDQLNFANCKSSNGSLFLEGNGALTRRANNNLITRCKFTGYKVAMKIGGIGNRVRNNCLNSPDNPVLLNNAGGTDFRAIFYDGYNNAFENNWLEGAATHVLVKMYGQGIGSQSAVCDFPISSVQLSGPNQIADLATTGAYGNLAAYSAANTLIVSGADVTATYPAGRQVWVDCGADGWRTSTVATATYGAPNTTIVLTAAALTANLATISPAFYPDRFRPNLATGCDLYYASMRPSRLYMGNGATHYLSAAIKGSTTYDFSANPLTVNAGAIASLSLSAPGTTTGMAVAVNTITTLPTGIVPINSLSGTDTITVKFYNPTAGNITINTSQTFKWVVFDGA